MKYTNVQIGNLKSYDNFGLVLLKLAVSAPKAKIKTIEVPGRRTLIDATESLYGSEITYENRTITMEFIHFHNGFEHWLYRYSDILNAWHGKRLEIILDDDPTYFYVGRIDVSSAKETPQFATFTITADVEPYKYSLTETTDPWEWDPFNFETGVVRSYEDLIVPSQGTLTVSVVGPQIPVRPTILSDKTISCEVGESEYTLAATIPVKLAEKAGEYDVVFTNNGPEAAMVNITFRGERL